MTERITPFGHIFAQPGFDLAVFAQVMNESQPDSPDSATAFLSLPAGGAALRQLVSDDIDPAHRADAVAQVGALLFHAFRFWEHGRVVYRFDDAALRTRLAASRSADEPIVPPLDAGYLQLPKNMLWASVGDGAAPEPADGIFWSATSSRIDLLLILGLRAGRPGVSLVDVGLEGTYDLAQWAATKARPDGDDFANVMPGGELNAYLSIITHGELLKLAAHCFDAAKSAGERVDEDGNVVIHVNG